MSATFPLDDFRTRTNEQLIPYHNFLGGVISSLFVPPPAHMPLALTRQEKRIIAVLALLIVLGLVGMALL
jgi:hypothetical protein